MTDLNNNLNVGGMRQNYTPGFKEKKTEPTVEQKTEQIPADDKKPQPGEVLGRSMVKKASSVNFKADMDAFMKNPALAERTIKAGDVAYELMEALDVSDAYAKACCGSLDAAYDKCKK